MSLYPLKFAPRFVDKMWGGRRLETVLGKTLPTPAPVGESWEIYDFPPGVIDGAPGWVSSPISNGPLKGKTLHEVITARRDELMGDVPLWGDQFPVLIKFLDAREDLSVQVHPDEAYARTHPEAHLKSEAWYVFDHEPGAFLYKGLAGVVSREAFARAIDSGTVADLIEKVPARKGDCHYLPSGTVHALGAGILAAEVQTPSDTTFRVFDFNRVDPSTGKTRKLHGDEALACIDFSGRPAPATPRSHVASCFTTVTRLVDCPFFRLEKVRFVEGAVEPIPYDQPVVWMMLEGKAEILIDGDPGSVSLTRGETVLLPARMSKPRIKTHTDCVWLEVTFPQR